MTLVRIASPSAHRKFCPTGPFGLAVLMLTANAHAATLTWVGTGGNKFASNAANWSPATVPANDSDIIIDSTNDSITWDASNDVKTFRMDSSFAGSVTLASNLGTTTTFVVNAGTLITAKDVASGLTSGTDFTIGSSGTVIIRRSSTSGGGAGQIISAGGNFTIAAGGKLIADGQGFDTGNGPGAGSSQANDGSGGAHGGRGADSSVTFGGAPYGQSATPMELGSGGGAGIPGGAAGAGKGGGAIRVALNGTATIDGTISANGNSSPVSDLGGGGAGGSIWLIATTFAGSGLLAANGGNSGGSLNGGGSGGRIAVSWQDTTFTGTVSLAPGTGAGGRQAEPGTYLFPDSFDLTVKAPLALAQGTYFIPNLIVTNGATLFLQGDPSTLPNGLGVTINSTTVTVAAGSSISADGQGFPTNSGPGGGNNQTCDGSGGGYGGAGADSSVLAGGGTYGSASAPAALGSGGGAGCPGGTGGTGSGGGAVTLNVSGPITINGTISANGYSGAGGTHGGGGSGGSIWIIANSVAGSGQLHADGGNGDGGTNGGGAGGRIAITPNSAAAFAYTFSGTISSNAGANGNSTAGSGTVYVPPQMSSASDQLFPGNGPSTAMQPLTITNRAFVNSAISAANGIRIHIPSTFNMEWDPAHATATLSGPQAAKVNPLISYPDNKTVLLTVNTDFGSGESFTLSGLAFRNFSAGSNPNPDALQLEVLNNGATQALDTHTIRIQDVTAFDDTGYTVTTGSTLNVAAPGVLANDTEIANHPLTAHLASPAAHGAVTLNADGSFFYTPTIHFVGTDSFTYVANNGTTDSLPATVTLVVNKATLTVTANNSSMVYGALVPAFTYTLSGFVSGDTATSIAGTPALTTPATSRSNSGNYAIVPSAGSLNSSTYTFAFVNGTLTVNKAPLTVTADDVVKAYGADIPALTCTFSGFRNGDSSAAVTGTPAFSTTATAASLEGTFPITVASGTLQSINYAFAFSPGTLTIVPSPPVIGSIALTPNPASTAQTVAASVEIITTQGVTASVQWDFGDGTTASGTAVQHAWTDAGIYTVTITAASPDGVSTSATQQVLISLTAGAGGTGGDPLGGVVIGSDPASSKLGKASAKINFAHRDKTSLACTVNGLNFPKSLLQSDLLLQPGTLAIGPAGPIQQTYQFTVDKNGHASATGVKFALTTKKSSLAFAVSGREGLTTLFESLGATTTTAAKGAAPIPLTVPATLRIGTKIYLAMTFKLKYVAKGALGLASTGK